MIYIYVVCLVCLSIMLVKVFLIYDGQVAAFSCWALHVCWLCFVMPCIIIPPAFMPTGI